MLFIKIHIFETIWINFIKIKSFIGPRGCRHADFFFSENICSQIFLVNFTKDLFCFLYLQQIRLVVAAAGSLNANPPENALQFITSVTQYLTALMVHIYHTKLSKHLPSFVNDFLIWTGSDEGPELHCPVNNGKLVKTKVFQRREHFYNTLIEIIHDMK